MADAIDVDEEARAILAHDDVTDRVKALIEELKASEERFRALVEGFPETVLIVTDALEVTYINNVGGLPEDDAHTRMQQIRGAQVRDITRPDDVDAAEAAIREAFETGRTTSYTARGISLWGDAVLHAKVAPLPGGGAPRRAIIVVRDETERHVAEGRMRLAEERLNFITGSGQVELWEVDRSADVAGGRRVDGETTPSLEDAMGPLDEASREKVRRALQHLDHSGEERFSIELEIADPDAGRGTLLTTGAVVRRDDDGQWTLLRGTSVDITEHKRAHAEQLALREQLQQAQKLEAIGQLAGGVAHDFNNLLQVILGHLTLALDDQAPGSPAAMELEAAQGAANKAAQLTRQLLTYARKQPHRPEVVSLAAVISSNLSMLERILPESVHIQWPASKVDVNIEADAGQLGQVLMNLCVNARDAMPDGGVLTIDAEVVELDSAHPQAGAAGAGRYVVLRVLDTGKGLSDDVIERGAEPFFTTKRPGEGSGLGLSVVAGIVQQHGGTLRLSNREGQGARVEVTLPVVDASPTIKPAAGQGRSLTPTDEGRRVLLAEDEEMVRNVLVRTLGRAGFEVLVATNGPEAVAIGRAADPPIDIAVIDAVMPGLSGREVCEALLKTNPALPVVIASGYSDSVFGPAFLEEHEIELIPKPFEGRVLVEAMRRALDRKDG
jgi:two-component system cell cycle sensor histidine kinase/response regulator CckA